MSSHRVEYPERVGPGSRRPGESSKSSGMVEYRNAVSGLAGAFPGQGSGG